MSAQSQFAHGQPVTVTLTDPNGEDHVFDGFINRGDLFAVTDMTRIHQPHVAVSPDTPGARQFVIVASASARPFGHDNDKWRIGKDHMFTGPHMWVAVEDATTVTVAEATETAMGRIEADLSEDRVVARAVAKIAETDPALAKRLRDAVDDLINAAYDRGVSDGTLHSS